MRSGTDVHVTLWISTLWVQNAMLRVKAMTPCTHSIVSVLQVEGQWAHHATVVHLLLWVLSQLPVFHVYCYDFLFIACILSQLPICHLRIVTIACLLPAYCQDCLFVTYILLRLPICCLHIVKIAYLLPEYCHCCCCYCCPTTPAVPLVR